MTAVTLSLPCRSQARASCSSLGSTPRARLTLGQRNTKPADLEGLKRKHLKVALTLKNPLLGQTEGTGSQNRHSGRDW